MARDAPFPRDMQRANNAPIARRKLRALSNACPIPQDGAESARPPRCDQMANDAPHASGGDRANRNHHAHGSKPKMSQLHLPNRLERESSREPSTAPGCVAITAA